MDRDFVNSMWPHAQRVSQRTGLDPRVVVAQAALETGWGKSAPGNNYFGIKSHGKPGGNNLGTWEVVNGQRVNINDNFRAYGGMGESADGYANFLETNPRYRPMLSASGIDAQIEELGKSGYATDPQYANKIRSIAKSIDPSGISDAPAPQQSGGQQVTPTISTRGAIPQQSAEERPLGLMGLLSGEGTPDARSNAMDRISLALMSMSAYPTAGMRAQMGAIQERAQDRRGEKKASAQRNKTAAWLRSQGLRQLADGVEEKCRVDHAK